MWAPSGVQKQPLLGGPQGRKEKPEVWAPAPFHRVSEAFPHPPASSARPAYRLNDAGGPKRALVGVPNGLTHLLCIHIVGRRTSQKVPFLHRVVAVDHLYCYYYYYYYYCYQIVPGRSRGFLLILHRDKPSGPWDKPSLRLVHTWCVPGATNQGRTSAENIYVLEVDVPYSLRIHQ